MPLSPGSRLGPYEITAPIGAGGMGEVYRARDTRLNRDVAVKILPDALAQDEAHVARFTREAQALAALKHPHICTAYDVGTENGITFLVMELIEGETLAERLQRRPMTVDETVTIGAQLAEALHAAHQVGIVHRDLKPANVILTASGPKLVDFGLAKARSASPLASFSLVATEAPVTGTGALVGTLNYMAPEQVEGREADARSDVFALGCVLYEMFTGTRAFDGPSAASVIAAILDRETGRVSHRQPLAAEGIDHVVAKCLAKTPENRWQTARDVATELRWHASREPQAATPLRAAMPRTTWLAVAAAAALVAGAAGYAAAVFTSPEAAPPVTRVALRTSPAFIAVDVAGPVLAISRDGRRLAFVGITDGRPQIYMQQLDQLSAVPVPGTLNGRSPFFSPDGQWIGFGRLAALYRVRVAGGAPERIADDGNLAFVWGAVWGTNDEIIYSGGDRGTLYRVPASGGTPVELLAGRSSRAFRWPSRVDDGTLLVGMSAEGGGAVDRVGILSIADGTIRELVTGADAAHYLSTGHVVYRNNNQLWVALFDRSRQQLGTPQMMLDGVGGGGLPFVVSDTGTLLFLHQVTAGTSGDYVAWLSQNGAPERLKLPAGRFGDVAISSDGARLAMTLRNPAANGDIWMTDLRRGVSTRLTATDAEEETPVWSPDASELAFAASRTGEPRTVYAKNLASGVERKVWSSEEHSHLYDWSRDGYILAGLNTAKGGNDIWLVRADGTGAEPLVASEFSEMFPAVSPDGRWLAFQSNEGGSGEIYVQPFPKPGPKTQVSVGGGTQPRWTRDGKVVFRANGKFYDVPVLVNGQVSPGQAVERAADPSVQGGHFNFDVAPDGRLLVSVIEATAGGQPAVVFNLFTDIRDRFARR